MVTNEANVPEWVSIWGIPKDVLGEISAQVDHFQNGTSKLRVQVRAIATETIDLLLSTPVPNDINQQKRDLIERYSAILVQFSSTTDDPDSTLNHKWTELDQSVSFYLLDAGQNADTDPTAIRDLINELTRLRDKIPGVIAEISNLCSAIEGSASALPGLDIAIAESSDVLKRTNGELDMGAAIMTRLIGMAEHQHKLLTGE